MIGTSAVYFFILLFLEVAEGKVRWRAESRFATMATVVTGSPASWRVRRKVCSRIVFEVVYREFQLVRSIFDEDEKINIAVQDL